MIALPSDRELADLSGYDIARVLGCHYTGDVSPIPHGGIFYSVRNWSSYGYASCVEIEVIAHSVDEGIVLVTRGTIHRSDDEPRMLAALDCIGMRDEWDRIASDPNNGSIYHLEIEACRAYRGIEPDGIGEWTFPLATWREWRIWRKVRPWIEELGRD